MAVATISEIQIILRIPFSKEVRFISDMLPIVESTIDGYFNQDFDAGANYPVALKRPAAILIKQMIENPGAVIRQEIGDDETTYGKIDLSAIFDGLDYLINVPGGSGGKFFNVKTINRNLGLGT